MSCPHGTIGLVYTNDEWSALDYQAHMIDGCDFRAHLFRRMIKLGRMAEGLDPSLEIIRQQKKFIIPADTSCQLLTLASRFDIPLATLVARFIVSPILKEHYETNGFPILRP